MIGIQGSGKTTLTKTIFPRHDHISLDKIGNFSKSKKTRLLESASATQNKGLSNNRKVEYAMVQETKFYLRLFLSQIGYLNSRKFNFAYFLISI